VVYSSPNNINNKTFAQLRWTSLAGVWHRYDKVNSARPFAQRPCQRPSAKSSSCAQRWMTFGTTATLGGSRRSG
jgi:hypothetical protein